MNTPLPNVNYIIVAHPDDETLFFASPLTRKDEIFKISALPTQILMVRRKRKGFRFVKKQGKKLLMPMIFMQGSQRSSCTSSKGYRVELEQFKENRQKVTIFTHGPVGEYMHPHHQDEVTQVYFERNRCFLCCLQLLSRFQYHPKRGAV